jgi:steroid delta-isomerase
VTTTLDTRALAEAYARAHGDMTVASIDAVIALCTETVIFHDPFNDTVGKPGLRHIFADMFKSTKEPRTEVIELFGGGLRWIIKWRFTAGLPVIGNVDTLGLTELTLAEDGRVASHIDYWDSGPVIYGKIPVLGAIVRSIRKRLSASSRP